MPQRPLLLVKGREDRVDCCRMRLKIPVLKDRMVDGAGGRIQVLYFQPVQHASTREFNLDVDTWRDKKREEILCRNNSLASHVVIVDQVHFGVGGQSESEKHQMESQRKGTVFLISSDNMTIKGGKNEKLKILLKMLSLLVQSLTL